MTNQAIKFRWLAKETGPNKVASNVHVDGLSALVGQNQVDCSETGVVLQIISISRKVLSGDFKRAFAESPGHAPRIMTFLDFERGSPFL